MSTPSVTDTSNTTNTVTNVSDNNSSDVNVDCSGKICTRCSYGSCTTFPNMYVTGIETNNSNNTIIGIIIFIVAIFILIGVCFYFRKRITDLFKRR